MLAKNIGLITYAFFASTAAFATTDALFELAKGVPLLIVACAIEGEYVPRSPKLGVPVVMHHEAQSHRQHPKVKKWSRVQSWFNNGGIFEIHETMYKKPSRIRRDTASRRKNGQSPTRRKICDSVAEGGSIPQTTTKLNGGG